MKKSWKYYTKKFDHEGELDDIFSGWYGLRRFGFDLVSFLEPTILVELGTHKGTSFLAFCNSVKKNKLKTKIFAVDTWQGDSQTGYYSQDVLTNLKKILKKHYSAINTKLVKKTFNEAVKQFKNKKIDLLHIDGLHTYEAVKNDYSTWKNLVSDNGIIIFHDIHCKEPGFGVYKFWSEIKKENCTLELKHSNGLGILFNNEKMYKQLKPLEKSWQAYYQSQAKLDQLLYFPSNADSELAKEYQKKIKKLENGLLKSNKKLKNKVKQLTNQLNDINNSKIQKIAKKYYSIRKKIINR